MEEQATNMTPARKPEVRINGQLYRLRFDLWALEQIEEEFGGIREAFAQLRGAKMSAAVRKLFRILANCQRNLDGMPEDVTEETISRHTSMAKLVRSAAPSRQRWKKAWRAKPTAGKRTMSRRTPWPKNMTEKTDRPAINPRPGVLRVRADRRDRDREGPADDAGLDHGYVQDPAGL